MFRSSHLTRLSIKPCVCCQEAVRIQARTREVPAARPARGSPARMHSRYEVWSDWFRFSPGRAAEILRHRPGAVESQRLDQRPLVGDLVGPVSQRRSAVRFYTEPPDSGASASWRGHPARDGHRDQRGPVVLSPHEIKVDTRDMALTGAPIGAQRLVIIGTGEISAIVFESFSWDSPHEVVAFSADRAYITVDTISGRPVVPLDELAATYPPSEFRVFVAVSQIGLNRVRRRLYNTVKSLGFECVSYVSTSAFVPPSVRIGENVQINGIASLAYNARVGNNVVIGPGAHIGHSAVIEDDCFLGPHATVSGFTRVGRGAFLGAGSCIADSLSVAENCVVGAGAVLLRDTVTRQVYLGNPARPTGRDSLETFPEESRGAPRFPSA